MMSWYLLALFAAFVLGVHRFIYKIASRRNYNTFLITFSYFTSIALLGSLIFFLTGSGIMNLKSLLIFGFLNGVSVFICTLTNLRGLKHIPTNIFHPIARSSPIITVLFGVFYFNESLSFYQTIGIILVILMMIILSKEEPEKEEKNGRNFKLGITLAVISLLGSGVAGITSKFAAENVNILAFIMIGRSISSLLSLSIKNQYEMGEKKWEAILLGAFTGTLSFAGFTALLKAMQIGPLSIVSTINSLGFILTIILSIIIYGEELNKERILGVILSVAAAILLRF